MPNVNGVWRTWKNTNEQYPHSDSEVADAIVSTLNDLGIETFRDIKNIGWGDPLSDSVRRGLESAAAILVILTPGSI